MKKGEDYTGVTIVYFCHDGEGNYFMARRSAQCRDEHGRWDCGSGSLEFGEHVEDTIRREILEEYGTEVISHEFLGYRDAHRELNGKPTHWVALDFKVHIDREKAHNAEPDKFDEIGWFKIDELPSPLHSQIEKALEQYRGRL